MRRSCSLHASTRAAYRPALRLCLHWLLVCRLIETAQAATEAEFNAGKITMKTLFVHKYADAVPVALHISMGGTDTQRLWVVDIKRVGHVATDMLVSGRLKHAGSE